MSFASSATYGPEGAYVEGRAHFTGKVVRAKTEVRVNGVYKGLVEIFQAKDSDKQFVVYKSGWGAGKVVLGPSYITESLDQEPTTASPKDTTKSGEFRVRYGVTRGTFSAVRKGGSMTFKGVGVKMYKIHKEVSAERAEVQVKTSRGWVTKKYLKLAANGNSVSWTIRTGKHYWRLRVPTSTTRLGSNSEVVHL
ncbi:MAG: hypothetical protein EON52_14895 [Actinomycetales bacterium]|nr:MAG: hypothetical protein EON52_14895 [Actinomycetales bacterium]